MRLSDFARDVQGSPSSEDEVVVEIDGDLIPVEAVEFRLGKVVLLPTAEPGEPVSGLSEQVAAQQVEFAGEDGSIPGLADVRAAQDSGAGIVDDLRGRNEGSLQTTESPGLNPADDPTTEDSGT